MFCVCDNLTRKAALATSALSMLMVLNLPCCRLLCTRLTALLTPRWMSCRVVAGKPWRSLVYSTSLVGGDTRERGCYLTHFLGLQHSGEIRAAAPEVPLQCGRGMVNHGTKTVDAGAGQSSADALLHNVETVIHHAGCQLTLLIRIHSNGLGRMGGGAAQYDTLLDNPVTCQVSCDP